MINIGAGLIHQKDMKDIFLDLVEKVIIYFQVHYTIMQWIRVGINVSCIDAYAVVEWANDVKLHIFATKHKTNTYHEHLIYSDDSVSI